MSTDFLKTNDELDFLADFRGPRLGVYRTAPFLRSEFDAAVWQCDFGASGFLQLDFRIKLYDGEFLTSVKHAELLEIFKYWICASCHKDGCGGTTYATSTLFYLITRTVKVIDYFLLNARKFELCEFGMKAITEDDLTCFLAALTTSNETTTSIYSWPTRLSNYLRSGIASDDIAELRHIIATRAEIAANIMPVQDRMLDLTDDEVLLAKAWLFRNGYYGSSTENWSNSPSTLLLASAIYQNTLIGSVKKPVPPELFLDPFSSIEREFPGVPVTAADNEKMSSREWHRFKDSLETLLALEELYLSIPEKSIRKIAVKDFSFFVSHKPPGRFRTLPEDVVLFSLKNAAEFIMTRGDSIIDSAINVMAYASSKNIACLDVPSEILNTLLCPKIANLGIRTWCLGTEVSGRARTARRKGSHKKNKAAAKQAYFVALRENQGLWELVRVLYGAIQVLVGTLMARRQDEFLKIWSADALDTSGRYLIFATGKSGTRDIRQSAARPIPQLGADAIRMLQRFHQAMCDIGVVEGDSLLFANPSAYGTRICTLLSPVYNEAMDRFCDYFETPITADGCRYYLRQHQLRRAFAMAFFWGGAFGGLDTLRWFLGHTDVEHLYHYITESVPGAVLRSIKLDYALHVMESSTLESDTLAEFVSERFGIKKYSVLESEEVEEYIGMLLDRGDVEVEPEFFETDGQKCYKIVIKIRKPE